MKNLNKLTIKHDNGFEWDKNGTPTRSIAEIGLADYSIRTSQPADIEVHFDRIEERIVELISRYEVAVGAVAWLSNATILKALGHLRRVGIVVQKEDFLRVDYGGRGIQKRRSDTRKLYDALPFIDSEGYFETYPGQQEYEPDYNGHVQSDLFDASGMFQFGGSAIKCIGYASRAEQTTPKMHHKFLVLGEFIRDLVIKPRIAITGSFNMTNNALRSRENIVVVHDRFIASRYVSEWAQLWAMAEDLDWSCSEPVVQTVHMGT